MYYIYSKFQTPTFDTVVIIDAIVRKPIELNYVGEKLFFSRINAKRSRINARIDAKLSRINAKLLRIAAKNSRINAKLFIYKNAKGGCFSYINIILRNKS